MPGEEVPKPGGTSTSSAKVAPLSPSSDSGTDEEQTMSFSAPPNTQLKRRKSRREILAHSLSARLVQSQKAPLGAFLLAGNEDQGTPDGAGETPKETQQKEKQQNEVSNSNQGAAATQSSPAENDKGAPAKLRSGFATGLANAKDINQEVEPDAYDAGWQQTLRVAMESNSFNIVILILTLLALFVPDLSVYFYHASGSYEIISHIVFACLIIFVFEIIIASLVLPGYFLQYFFWLDVIGTASLITDIYWIKFAVDDIMNDLQVARAGRVARTGTRASRLVRLVRVFKILRLVRLYKYVINSFLFAGGKKLYQVDSAKSGKETPSKVGEQLALIISNRVVILVLILLFGVPFFDLDTDLHARVSGIAMMNAAYLANNSDFLQEQLTAYGTTDSNFKGAIFDGVLTLAPSSTTYDFSTCVRQLIAGHNDTYVCPFGENNGPRIIVEYLPSLREPNTTAYFDATDMLWQASTLNILLTIFVLLIFISAAFILNRDSHELIVRPIERMTRVTARLAGTLFALSPQEAANIEGHEAAFVEEVVGKMAQFFNVKKAKITTIYTPGNDVWNVEVSRETRDDTSSGIGQRIPVERLVQIRRRSLNGSYSRQTQVRDPNLFHDLIRDPMAIRFLRSYLKKEYSVENLNFWQEVERFRVKAAEVLAWGRRIFDCFICEAGSSQINIQSKLRREIEDVINYDKIDFTLFDNSQREIFTMMQKDVFPRFCKSVLFKQLITEKNREDTALPSTIIEEHNVDETVWLGNKAHGERQFSMLKGFEKIDEEGSDAPTDEQYQSTKVRKRSGQKEDFAHFGRNVEIKHNQKDRRTIINMSKKSSPSPGKNVRTVN